MNEKEAGEKKGILDEMIEKAFGFFTHRVPLLEKVFFTKHFSVMLKAGIPLTEGLRILSKETSNKYFQSVICDVEKSVTSGGSLYKSMKAYSDVFDEVYLNMINVGEISGNLENTMKDLAVQQKKDYDLRSKVRGALIYPSFVFTALLGVAVVVFTFVLPRLKTVFESMETELPLSTRFLIGISDFVVRYGLFLFFGIVLLIILGRYFARTEDGKKIFHYLNLSYPIFGNLIQKLNIARFSRILSTLMRSGLSTVEALKILSSVLSNYYYRKIMEHSSVKVRSGVSLRDALSVNEKLIRPMILEMIAVGEKTGKTEEILADLASFYEGEIEQTTKNLSSMIEPILVLLLGISVAFISISVLSPIYGILESF